MTTEKSILVALGHQCSCRTQCSDRWSKVALRQARRNYFSLTKLEQLQKVYEILLGARNVVTQEILLSIAGIPRFCVKFNKLVGHPVCREAFMAYHGISTYHFYSALKHVDEGTSPQTVHGNQLLEHSSAKRDLCIAWLGRICSELAEGLPTGFKLELSKRVWGKHHLILIILSQMTRDDLFVQMREEFTEAGMSPLEIPSPQTFRFVWRTNFPQLKIPRHNTLGVCGTCLDLKQEIRSLPSRSLEQQNLKGAFKAHLYQVKSERHAQIERDQSAAAFPQDSWTITTDFMQDLFQPYLHHRPKSWFVFFRAISEF